MEDRIKAIRDSLGLTLAEFAGNMGVTTAAVSYWEHGRPIPESRVKSICQTFGIDENWFRTGEGEMFAEQTAKELHEFTDEELVVETGLRLYKKLSDEGREVVDKLIERIKERETDSERQESKPTS